MAILYKAAPAATPVKKCLLDLSIYIFTTSGMERRPSVTFLIKHMNFLNIRDFAINLGVINKHFAVYFLHNIFPGSNKNK